MVMWLHCSEEEHHGGEGVAEQSCSGNEGRWRPSVAFKDRCQ